MLRSLLGKLWTCFDIPIKSSVVKQKRKLSWQTMDRSLRWSSAMNPTIEIDSDDDSPGKTVHRERGKPDHTKCTDPMYTHHCCFCFQNSETIDDSEGHQPREVTINGNTSPVSLNRSWHLIWKGNIIPKFPISLWCAPAKLHRVTLMRTLRLPSPQIGRAMDSTFYNLIPRSMFWSISYEFHPAVSVLCFPSIKHLQWLTLMSLFLMVGLQINQKWNVNRAIDPNGECAALPSPFL